MPSMFSVEHEHEQREHEGEIFHPVGADIVAHHVGDELVGNLGDRLQPRRHQRAAVHGVNGEERDEGGGDHHEQRRVGEGRVEAEQLEGDEPLDLELMHGVGQAAGAAAAVLCPFRGVCCVDHCKPPLIVVIVQHARQVLAGWRRLRLHAPWRCASRS